VIQQPGSEGTRLIYLAALNHAEQRLAASLTELDQGRHPCSEINVGKAIE
jgi:hypothetical protein